MWRTSSWIGVDGLIAAYRQRHPDLLAGRLRFPRRHTPARPAAI